MKLQVQVGARFSVKLRNILSKLKFRKNLCTTLHGFAQIYAILFDCTANKVKILFFVLIYDTGRGRIRSVESMNKACIP